MNTLEVTYADKAGRLIEGSPDKVKIEELQAQVQELQGKTLKIYYVEDDSIGPEDLADVEDLLDSLAAGEYQAVQLSQSTIMYVVVHGDAEDFSSVQLVTLADSQLTSVYYETSHDETGWIYDDDPNTSYRVNLSNLKPIYWHGLALTNTGSTSTKFFNFHVLNNSNEAFTLASFISWAESIDGIVDIPVTGVYRITDVPISIPTLLRKNDNNTWRLYYNTGDTMGNVSISMSEFNTVTDSINKVN